MPGEKKSIKQLPLTEQGEIANLLKTGKLCQDVLQLYRIFERGMSQLDRVSDLMNLTLPPTINRDTMGSAFVRLISDPRISPEKIHHMISSLLGESSFETSLESVRLKIMVLSLMRDAVKELSPNRVYKSIQHRDDLYFAIIEALEELEDEVEELENKELSEEENATS